VSEVLRRHQLDESTFYPWERQAKEGAREALEGRVVRNGKGSDREIERLEQDLEKKRRVIAEVVVLAEEKEAVIAYAPEHPKDGYRRLAWMMSVASGGRYSNRR